MVQMKQKKKKFLIEKWQRFEVRLGDSNLPGCRVN